MTKPAGGSGGSGAAGSAAFGTFRIAMPSSGAKSTATTQEIIWEIATTAKMAKVYSPAELLAKPIGTKPAVVTSDPVSIGAASVR